MDIRFEKILIPVDFTINTEVAIHQALALAEPGRSVLHLLHVQKETFSGMIGYNIFSIYNQVEEERINNGLLSAKLYALQSSILQTRRDIQVSSHMISGVPVEAAVIDKALQIAPDLILIAKRSHHLLFPFLNTVVPSRITIKTGIPVLTSKPGSIHQSIKTIVVPIGKKFPQRKIDIINALRKKAGLHIRLVTFSEDDSKQVRALLIHVYRLLRSGNFMDIHLETISAKNKAKAIVDYCEKVEADLLLVTPGQETKAGWMNKHISDLMPATSKTQVLAI